MAEPTIIEVIASVPDDNGNTMLYESDAERILSALRANPEVVLRALGMSERPIFSSDPGGSAWFREGE